MSGEITRGRMGSPRDRLEDLQSDAEAVQNMVKQLKGTKMDFERDMTDPFEPALARSEKGGPHNPRAWYDPVRNVSPSRGRGYGRGRPQRSRGGRGNRTGRVQGYSPREAVQREDCPHSLPFDQISQGSDSGSERSYKSRGYWSHKKFTQRRNSADEQNLSPQQASGPAGEEPNPSQIVSALTEFPDFRASLLQLMEMKGMMPTHVRSTVSKHTNVFQLSTEIVELVPKISLCTEHTGENGCLNQASCKELHLCPLYVTSWCNSKNCIFGHKWFTDHNKCVLRSFYLNDLSAQDLRKLFRSLKVASEQQGPLEICKEYNGNGCSKPSCDALHVCLSFVASRTRCSRSGCRLNHDILTTECCMLLAQHGISTNETPRDVVVALLAANPSLVLPETSQKEDQQTNNEQKTEKKEALSGQRDEDKQANKELKNEDQQEREKKSEDQQKKEKRSEDQQKKEKRSEDQQKKEKRSEAQQKSTRTRSDDKKTGEVQNISDSEVYQDEFFLSDSSSDDLDSNDGAQKKKRGLKSSKRKPSKPYVKDKKADDYVPRKAEPRKTAWSHDLQGDTEIGEICYYSVESICRNEKNACPRLHSGQHYHWQVSEQGDSWLNLPDQQVKSLEVAFCDPSLDGVTLPRLDPAKLGSSQRDFFKVMGRDTWQANFEAMILTNSDYSRVMILRRLCTQNVPGKTDNLNRYHWFFLDKNKKWVKYGNVDTAGETNLVSSVTSDDIEKHYLQNPRTPLNFQNASYKYTLDFNKMTQKNQGTNVVREVRRRPEPHINKHSKDNGDSVKAQPSGSAGDAGIPSTWVPMQPQERVRIVPLDPSNTEYQSVINLLNGGGGNPSVGGLGTLNVLGNNFPMPVGGASLPIPVPGFPNTVTRLANNLNVVKIERVQNPFLWRAFQNKVREMTTVYGDIKKVDVRQVFHGTKSSVVSNICAENFDWRLHGTNAGQACGRGTYFSPNASTSLGYCQPDTTRHRHIFVALVAVGSITSGNASTVRPPINQATGFPFDSTGDGVNVIVKYDKQEYYPEYLVTLT